MKPFSFALVMTNFLIGGGLGLFPAHDSLDTMRIFRIASTAPRRPLPARLNFYSFWSQPPSGIAFDVAWIRPQSPRVFTPADFLDCHFWDHGRRFTFVLPLTHVVLSRRPPVPGMTVIALNRNLPLHDTVVNSVRLHPMGSALQVTCSLARPAFHVTLGVAPDIFTFTFHE